MKLLAKTSLYYLVLSIPILIVSGFVCYFFIVKEVKDSNNELLLNRTALIETYLKNNDTISLQLITKSKEAQITKWNTNNLKNHPKVVFSDTLLFDKKENELAVNRMITSVIKVGSTIYQVKIWRSTIEFAELFEGIFYLLIFILFSLILISVLINFWISKTIWKPFYSTIQKLKTFSASSNQVPTLEKTTVKEFDQLNTNLYSMMNKMIVDYNNQKKFTENAAHEIQTPLAVIKSKVDLLIQSQNLKVNDVELIQTIDDACTRLIKLSKSLLLLSKIENRQFNTTETVSVKILIANSLQLFEDYIAALKLEISQNYETDFFVTINPDLGQILINNLIQNSIRHNIENGKITITINHNSLTILNTGNSKKLNSDMLYKRFHNESFSQLSNGLGLAIAHEIAVTSSLILHYDFVTDCHEFKLMIK